MAMAAHRSSLLRALLVGTLVCLVSAGARGQSSPEAPAPRPDAPRFTPPVLVNRVAAEYPREALAADLEGTVVLEFTVDDKGAVGDVVVKTPAGHGFDEAAVAAC